MSTSSTRFWMPPELPGVSCLVARFTAQHFPPHSHEALVIAVTEAGGSRYTSRGRSDEATASQLLVFNPVEPHAGHMRGSRGWHYRGWYLSEHALQAMAADTGRRYVPGFTGNAVADPSLIAAFLHAHRELEHGDPALAREQLVEACGHLFARWGADGSTPTAVRVDRTHVDRALRVIRDRFREGVNLDALARAEGLSPFQLIRQFRRVTGMPPHAHLVRARLHHAVARIRRGADLTEAALDAGFFDQAALTRAFRRVYGITPGQYRQAVRQRDTARRS